VEKKGYKNLIVWQKSMVLAEVVYKLTSDFSENEKYGLVSQMRRCSVSIPSNIAEGSRRTEKERINFLRTSFGSGSELETQLNLSNRLGFISEGDYNKTVEILSEVMKMLNKMIFVTFLFHYRLLTTF